MALATQAIYCSVWCNITFIYHDVFSLSCPASIYVVYLCYNSRLIRKVYVLFLMNNSFLFMVISGMTLMEITIVSTVGSVFFIFVAALAAIFFKKHSKSSKKCSCYFSVRYFQLFKILI